MTQLTPRFSLAEFLKSGQAARTGRVIEDPPPMIIANLTRLAESVLEPLRTIIGRPIVITSGYRPPWLNALVGGSKASDHMTGCAADIVVHGLTPYVLARRVQMSDLPVKQCILEFGEWVHVSVMPPGLAPKREYLTATHRGGRTVYLPGLVEKP